MVYFVRPRKGGPIKIGHTDRLRDRLPRLESELGCRLEVLAITDGGREREQDLHERFRALRLGRSELFRPDPGLLAYITSMARPWTEADDAPPRDQVRAAKGIKGRTVSMPDDLFERVLVQAHRKGKTISEYVVMVLERGVPDHRAPRRAGRPEAAEAEGQGDAA